MLYYKIDVIDALKKRGYTTYKIRKEKIIGEAQLTKIRSGEMASKETINKICELLQVQPGDIMGYKDSESHRLPHLRRQIED